MVSHATRCNLGHNPARTHARRQTVLCEMRPPTRTRRSCLLLLDLERWRTLSFRISGSSRHQNRARQTRCWRAALGQSGSDSTFCDLMVLKLLKGVNGRDAASTEADIDLAERGPDLIISAFLASCKIYSSGASDSFLSRSAGHAFTSQTSDKSSCGEILSVSDRSCSAEVDAHKERWWKNTGVRRVRENGRCTARVGVEVGWRGGGEGEKNKRASGRIDEHECVRER